MSHPHVEHKTVDLMKVESRVMVIRETGESKEEENIGKTFTGP